METRNTLINAKGKDFYHVELGDGRTACGKTIRNIEERFTVKMSEFHIPKVCEKCRAQHGNLYA